MIMPFSILHKTIFKRNRLWLDYKMLDCDISGYSSHFRGRVSHIFDTNIILFGFNVLVYLN